MRIVRGNPQSEEVLPSDGSPEWFWEPSLGMVTSGFPAYVDSLSLDAADFVGTTTARPLVEDQGRGECPLFDGSNDALVYNGSLNDTEWTHEDQGAILMFAFIPRSGGVDGYLFDSSRIAATRRGIGFLFDTSAYLRVRICNGDAVNYVSVDQSILGVEVDEPHVASVRFGASMLPQFTGRLNGADLNHAQFDYALGSGNSYTYPRFGTIAGGGTYPWKGTLLGAYGKSGSITKEDARVVEQWFRRRCLPSLWWKVDAANGYVVAIQGASNHRIEIYHDVVPASHKDVWRVTGDMYRHLGKRTDFLSAWESAWDAGGHWMGSSHGNEELTITGATLDIDQIGTSLAVDACGSCGEIVLTQETELLDPTLFTPVATKTTVHTITAESMSIKQTIVWSAAVSLDSPSYAAMFPRDHWGVSVCTRGDGSEEQLTDDDQVGVYATKASLVGPGTGIRERVELVHSAGAGGLPHAPQIFVVGHATIDPVKRSKLYFVALNEDYTTTPGESWEWTTTYWFDASGEDDFPLGAWAWDVYWDADNGTTLDGALSPTVESWLPRISRLPLEPASGEEPTLDSFPDGRSVVQFDSASYDCLRANEYAEYCSGDDTTFTIAVHFEVVGALSSGKRLWSAATTADATHYYSIRFGTSTVYPCGRDGGAEVSGSAGATIAQDTEYTMLFVRHGDTYDIFLDGVAAVTAGTLTLGTLGTLNTFCIADLLRSVGASRYPANLKVRRFAFVRGDAMGLAEAIAIEAAWKGK